MADLNRKLDIDDISTLNISINQLLASDAIVAVGNVAEQTYDPEFNELVVPLPEVRSLSGLSNRSSSEVVVTENAIDKAYNALDEKLDKTRGRLITMLSVLGYSTWKKDLKELQIERGLEPADDELALIEELVEKKFKGIDLDSKKGIEDFRKRKVGGSMSNLQNSLNEYDNAGGNSYLPGVFRVTWWVGHTAKMKEQVESEKQTVKTFLKQVEKASQDIRNAQRDLDETKGKIVERENLLSLAGEQFEDGVELSAVNAASRADKLFEDIKGSLNTVNESLFDKRVNFDGSIEDRFAFNYSREISQLRELNQGWAEVDANYETAIAIIDGTSKACIMVSAAGLGCIVAAAAVPVGSIYLTGVGITTLVGGIVTGGIAGGATGVSHLGRFGVAAYHGQSYDWNAATEDVSNTTFQGALLGAGGGVVRLFGLGASSVPATSYVFNLARAGTTSVLFQLPSSVYYGVGDFNSQVAQLEAGLNDDILSDDEKKMLASLEEFNSLFTLDEQTGNLYDQDGRVVTAANLRNSEDAIRILKNNIGGTAFQKVGTLYAADTLLNFGCGMFGHAFQSMRLNAAAKLNPRPITPVPATTRSMVSGGVRKTSVVYLNGMSHLFESMQTFAAAEANLQFRQGFLGETITSETRARVYSMAFSSQVFSHIQTSHAHRENMRTQRVTEQGSAHTTDVLQQRLKDNSVLEIDGENSIHLVQGKAPASSDGKYYISIGSSSADLDLAMKTLPQKIRDIELGIQNKKAGDLVSLHAKKELAEMNSAVQRAGKTSSMSDGFIKDLSEGLKTFTNRSALRAADLDPIKQNATKADLAEISINIREKADILIAESRLNRSRSPEKGTLRKAVKGALVKAVRSVYSDPLPKISNPLKFPSIKLPSVIKFPLDFTVEFVKQRGGLFTASHAFLQYGANYGGAVTVFAVGGATLLHSVSSGLKSFMGFKMANGRNAAAAIAARGDMELLLEYDTALKKVDSDAGLDAKGVKRAQKEIQKANKFLAKSSSKNQHGVIALKTGAVGVGAGVLSLSLGPWALAPVVLYPASQYLKPVISRTFNAGWGKVSGKPRLTKTGVRNPFASGIRKVNIEQINGSYKRAAMNGRNGSLKNGLADLETALKTKMSDSYAGAEKIHLKIQKAEQAGASAGKILKLKTELQGATLKDFSQSLDVLLRDVGDPARANMIRNLVDYAEGNNSQKAKLIRELAASSVEEIRAKFKEDEISGSSIKKIVESTNKSAAHLEAKKHSISNLRFAKEADILSYLKTVESSTSYANLKKEFLGDASGDSSGLLHDIKAMAQRLEEVGPTTRNAQSKTLSDAASKIEDYFKVREVGQDVLKLFKSYEKARPKHIEEMFSEISDLRNVSEADILSYLKASESSMSYRRFKEEFLGGAFRGQSGLVNDIKVMAKKLEEVGPTISNAQSKTLLNTAKKIENYFEIKKSNEKNRPKEIKEIFKVSNLNAKQKLEVLKLVEAELDSKMDRIVLDEVRSIIATEHANPPGFIGRTYNWLARPQKSHATKAIAGHEIKKDSRGKNVTDSKGRLIFESDIKKQTKEIIDGPRNKQTDETKVNDKLVQKAAEESQKLNISKRSDADTIIEALVKDENALPHNLGITKKMRALAKKMRELSKKGNGERSPIQQGLEAQESLRSMLLKNLEVVESHFKSIKENTNISKQVAAFIKNPKSKSSSKAVADFELIQKAAKESQKLNVSKQIDVETIIETLKKDVNALPDNAGITKEMRRLAKRMNGPLALRFIAEESLRTRLSNNLRIVESHFKFVKNSIDVDKQTKGFIDRVKNKSIDETGSDQKVDYRYVRQAAKRSKKLNISKRSDAENIIKGLKEDHNGLSNNAGITRKMRRLAKQMNNSNRSAEERLIAEGSLREDLLKNFEIVESHFKVIKENADTSMEKLTAKVKDDVVARESRNDNFNRKMNEIERLRRGIENSREFSSELRKTKPNEDAWSNDYRASQNAVDFDQQLISQMAWNREIWLDNSAMRDLREVSTNMHNSVSDVYNSVSDLFTAK